MKKILLFIVVLLLVLSGCAQSTSKKEVKEVKVDQLNVTYVTSPLNVPSILEKQQQAFSKALDGALINYPEITSGAEQSQALASGDVQLLHAIGGSSVVAAAAGGVDIKIINMYSRAPKAFALFSKDSSLTTPTSLKGKKIAGPAGTNLHELLVAYLKQENLTIQDVEFISMGIADAFAAVESGSVDVALLGGPAAYKAQQAGLHKVTDGEGLIEAIIAVATTQQYYQENKAVIDRLIEAQKELRQYMKDHPQEVKELVMKTLNIDEMAYDTMVQQYNFATEVSDQDIKGLQNTADFMYENGMIKTKVNAADLFIK